MACLNNRSRIATFVEEMARLLTIRNRILDMLWMWRWIQPGAIIGDGDRKSWDARGPMIWDNFSIFRTNCATLTSYNCASPRTCREFSRGCCHVAWSKMVRVASFHSNDREKGREEEPELFYALLCSELMDKVSFSGSKISLISRFEWIISARAGCFKRKLLRLLKQENSSLWYRVSLWVS